MEHSIFLILTIATIVNGQSLPRCVFRDAGTSGLQLDLRALADTTLKKSDDLTPQNQYEYSPCQNGIDLDICAPDTAMAVKLQGEPPNYEKCDVIANWDTDAQSTIPYYNSAFERWTFNYSTGNDCNNEPYKFFVYYNCDPDIGDYRVVSVGSPQECEGLMYIDTQWACPGEIYTTPAPIDNSLSAGSIIVIILLLAFLIYFTIGYIICAILNRKDYGYCDVQANIPHIVFWIKLPALVMAGCMFTKDFLLALCSCDNKIDDKTSVLVQSQENINDNPFANVADSNNNPFQKPSDE
eukprot:449791_1